MATAARVTDLHVRPQDHVQALSRGLRVLEHVHRAPAPVSVRDIADAVGLNVSTAHHLVNTLVFEGYLVRRDDRLLTLGRAPVLDRSGMAGEQAPEVRRALGKAAYSVDDVAVLSRLDAGLAHITAAAEVPGAPNAGRFPCGASALAHLSAVGQVLVACLPAEAAERAIEDMRVRSRERRELFDEAAVRADLEQARAQGFATVSDGDHACVAAALTGAGGEAVGAVALVVEARRLRQGAERLVAITRSTAATLSRELPRLSPPLSQEEEQCPPPAH